MSPTWRVHTEPGALGLTVTVDATDQDTITAIEQAADAVGIRLERVDETEPPGYDVKACSSCEAPIIWAETTRGSRMPIDAEPTAGGVFILRRNHGDEALLAIHAPDLERWPDEPRYVSHFATCPDADQHRRR